MARKKQEAQLQTELDTQEQWDDMLSKEGLIVVDVYQEWCGPCTSMVANLRRLRNELAGDELLRFAVGKTDTVESLEKYRGRCEPCFHLYAGGQLVNIIRGANSPLLMRCIVEELNKEKKVLAGEAERQTFIDPVLAAQEALRLAEKADEALDTPESALKEVSIAIVKPNIFAKGNVDDIVQMISDKFEVLAKQEFTFTEEWVKEFYSHIESEPMFEDLTEFMTSGPCLIMVLTNASGDNVCTEFRDFIGNKDPALAKQENPDSLRAKFGDDVIKNGIHGSEPGEAAQKETALVVALMPDLVIPKRPPKPRLMQFLIVIPPDMVATAPEKVKVALEEHEFRIIRTEEIPMVDEVFEKLFDSYRKDDIEEFSRLHKLYMNNGPVVVFVVEKMEGITEWIELFGPLDVIEAHQNAPDSLVASLIAADAGVNKCDVYFSTLPSKGKQEATFMLRHLDTVKPIAKPEYTIAAVKPDALLHRDDVIKRIMESGFQIVDRIERKLTPELVMRMYINHQGQSYFAKILDHLTSGPTMFFILYREDAISGWRSLMGPRDPVQAKKDFPDSIRAMVGQDVVRNAVFGSDSPAEAAHLLRLVWGQNAEVTEDGRLMNATPIPSRPVSGNEAKPQSQSPAPAQPQQQQEPPQQQQQQQPPPQETAKPPSPKPAEPAREPIRPAETPKPQEQPQNTRNESTLSEKAVPSMPTIIPADNFDAKHDAEALEKAMKGVGADEDKMIAVLTRRSWQQRVAIAQKFNELYSKDLEKVFEAEATGDFLDLMKSLVRTPTELAAHNLNRAVKGAGTDEDCLIEIICTSSVHDLQAIKAEYQKLFGKTLQAAVEEDTSGPFRDVLVRLLNRENVSGSVDADGAKADAARLKDEIAKGGKNGTDCLTSLLVERSHAHLAAIFDAFKHDTQKSITDAISSSFSGDVKEAYLAVVGTIINKNAYFATRLRASTEGLGTRDFQLIRILVSRCEIDLETIKSEYERLYGATLLKHVADDTTGDYKHGLVSLITGNNTQKKVYEEPKNVKGPSMISKPPTPPAVGAEKKVARTNSQASVASSVKSTTNKGGAVSKEPTKAPSGKASPAPSVKEPLQPTQGAKSVSRQSSVASVKSTKSNVAVPKQPEPPSMDDDDDEAKPIDG